MRSSDSLASAKRGIGELPEEALAERGLVEVDVGHSLARLGRRRVPRSTFGHEVPLSIGANSTVPACPAFRAC
jgi:hypothetical protein